LRFKILNLNKFFLKKIDIHQSMFAIKNLILSIFIITNFIIQSKEYYEENYLNFLKTTIYIFLPLQLFLYNKKIINLVYGLTYGVILNYFLTIIFGNELIFENVEDYYKTFYYSLISTIIIILPVHSIFSNIFSIFLKKEFSKEEKEIYYFVIIIYVSMWISLFPIPLDWDTKWFFFKFKKRQKFPFCTTYGLFFGHLLSTLFIFSNKIFNFF
jgi:hypothetical protein